LDTNVPKGLTVWACGQGHEAEHVLDLGLGRSLDPELWRRAVETGAVIITKDEDFADMVRRSSSGPAVIWLRTGNGTTADLLSYLEPLWRSIEARLLAGDRLIEVR